MSEQVYLHSAGTLPGIPGVLGPGLYEVDYDTRTVTPVLPVVVESTIEPAQEPTQEPDPNATQPLADSTTVQTQDETTTTEQQQ